MCTLSARPVTTPEFVVSLTRILTRSISTQSSPTLQRGIGNVPTFKLSSPQWKLFNIDLFNKLCTQSTIMVAFVSNTKISKSIFGG
eukprot:2559730-Amphidinium_carterae.1